MSTESTTPSVTYKHAESKRLGSAILKFLELHLNNTRLAPDQSEGLGVAIQCLELVFGTNPTEAKDLPDLMQVFNAAAGEVEAPTEASADDKEKAEKAKTAGNNAVKEKKFSEAVEHYTEAIKLDDQSCVYYCNRAAAYTNLEKFHEALDDCKKAIAINSDYAKAFSRMGLIYSKLQFFAESVTCYETAISLEPDNEGYKKNHEIVKEKSEDQKKQEASQQGFAAGAAGAISTGAMPGNVPAGMPAGPDGMPANMMDAYQQFAGNPQFQDMAQKVMSNPNMKNMVDNFMGNMGIQPNEDGEMPSNPMDALAGSMGQGMGMQDLMQLGQQFAQHLQQENPEMISQLRTDMMGMAPPGTEEPKSEDPK